MAKMAKAKTNQAKTDLLAIMKSSLPVESERWKVGIYPHILYAGRAFGEAAKQLNIPRELITGWIPRKNMSPSSFSALDAVKVLTGVGNCLFWLRNNGNADAEEAFHEFIDFISPSSMEEFDKLNPNMQKYLGYRDITEESFSSRLTTAMLGAVEEKSEIDRLGEGFKAVLMPLSWTESERMVLTERILTGGGDVATPLKNNAIHLLMTRFTDISDEGKTLQMLSRNFDALRSFGVSAEGIAKNALLSAGSIFYRRYMAKHATSIFDDATKNMASPQEKLYSFLWLFSTGHYDLFVQRSEQFLAETSETDREQVKKSVKEFFASRQKGYGRSEHTFPMDTEFNPKWFTQNYCLTVKHLDEYWDGERSLVEDARWYAASVDVLNRMVQPGEQWNISSAGEKEPSKFQMYYADEFFPFADDFVKMLFTVRNTRPELMQDALSAGKIILSTLVSVFTGLPKEETNKVQSRIAAAVTNFFIKAYLDSTYTENDSWNAQMTAEWLGQNNLDNNLLLAIFDHILVPVFGDKALFTPPLKTKLNSKGKKQPLGTTFFSEPNLIFSSLPGSNGFPDLLGTYFAYLMKLDGRTGVPNVIFDRYFGTDELLRIFKVFRTLGELNDRKTSETEKNAALRDGMKQFLSLLAKVSGPVPVLSRLAVMTSSEINRNQWSFWFDENEEPPIDWNNLFGQEFSAAGLLNFARKKYEALPDDMSSQTPGETEFVNLMCAYDSLLALIMAAKNRQPAGDISIDMDGLKKEFPRLFTPSLLSMKHPLFNVPYAWCVVQTAGAGTFREEVRNMMKNLSGQREKKVFAILGTSLGIIPEDMPKDVLSLPAAENSQNDFWSKAFEFPDIFLANMPSFRRRMLDSYRKWKWNRFNTMTAGEVLLFLDHEPGHVCERLNARQELWADGVRNMFLEKTSGQDKQAIGADVWFFQSWDDNDMIPALFTEEEKLECWKKDLEFIYARGNGKRKKLFSLLQESFNVQSPSHVFMMSGYAPKETEYWIPTEDFTKAILKDDFTSSEERLIGYAHPILLLNQMTGSSPVGSKATDECSAAFREAIADDAALPFWKGFAGTLSFLDEFDKGIQKQAVSVALPVIGDFLDWADSKWNYTRYFHSVDMPPEALCLPVTDGKDSIPLWEKLLRFQLVPDGRALCSPVDDGRPFILALADKVEQYSSGWRKKHGNMFLPWAAYQTAPYTPTPSSSKNHVFREPTFFVTSGMKEALFSEATRKWVESTGGPPAGIMSNAAKMLVSSVEAPLAIEEAGDETIHGMTGNVAGLMGAILVLRQGRKYLFALPDEIEADMNARATFTKGVIKMQREFSYGLNLSSLQEAVEKYVDREFMERRVERITMRYVKWLEDNESKQAHENGCVSPGSIVMF